MNGRHKTTVPSSQLAAPQSPKWSWIWSYLAIARFDHATKHVFIIPGVILAYVLRKPSLEAAGYYVALGFCSAVLIASANYVINEWLDRQSDAYHPQKSQRTAVHQKLSPTVVYGEYILLAGLGLALAYQVGFLFVLVAAIFLLSGIVYNVYPIRLKDVAYLDVLTESVNNPIRLVLGWTMIDKYTLPPSSLLLAYWMGGGFLMAAKRLSEYREIADGPGVEVLYRYRRSFVSYTSESLIISCFLYAMLSAFFIAIFLIKYRIEYVLALPFIAIMFATYLWLSLLPGSIAQRPERLFRSRRLVLIVVVTVAVLLVSTFVDFPALESLSTPYFINLSAKGISDAAGQWAT